MFISSYNTYIDTSTTKKTQDEKQTQTAKKEDSFAPRLINPTEKPTLSNSNAPLTYISNYKALSTRQLLDQQDDKYNLSKKKFLKLQAQNSSKISYTENSKKSTFFIEPKSTINQTPKVDKNLPQRAQEKQESFMRFNMVNTYIANDNYYKITAA